MMMFKTYRYRKKISGCQRGKGLGHWVKEIKGLRNTNW